MTSGKHLTERGGKRQENRSDERIHSVCRHGHTHTLTASTQLKALNYALDRGETSLSCSTTHSWLQEQGWISHAGNSKGAKCPSGLRAPCWQQSRPGLATKLWCDPQRVTPASLTAVCLSCPHRPACRNSTIYLKPRFSQRLKDTTATRAFIAYKSLASN